MRLFAWSYSKMNCLAGLQLEPILKPCQTGFKKTYVLQLPERANQLLAAASPSPSQLASRTGCISPLSS